MTRTRRRRATMIRPLDVVGDGIVVGAEKVEPDPLRRGGFPPTSSPARRWRQQTPQSLSLPASFLLFLLVGQLNTTFTHATNQLQQQQRKMATPEIGTFCLTSEQGRADGPECYPLEAVPFVDINPMMIDADVDFSDLGQVCLEVVKDRHGHIQLEVNFDAGSKWTMSEARFWIGDRIDDAPATIVYSQNSRGRNVKHEIPDAAQFPWHTKLDKIPDPELRTTTHWNEVMEANRHHTICGHGEKTGMRAFSGEAVLQRVDDPNTVVTAFAAFESNSNFERVEEFFIVCSCPVATVVAQPDTAAPEPAAVVEPETVAPEPAAVVEPEPAPEAEQPQQTPPPQEQQPEQTSPFDMLEEARSSGYGEEKDIIVDPEELTKAEDDLETTLEQEEKEENKEKNEEKVEDVAENKAEANNDDNDNAKDANAVDEPNNPPLDGGSEFDDPEELMKAENELETTLEQKEKEEENEKNEEEVEDAENKVEGNDDAKDENAVNKPNNPPLDGGGDPAPQVVEPGTNPPQDGGDPAPQVGEPGTNPPQDGGDPAPQTEEPGTNPPQGVGDPAPQMEEPGQKENDKSPEEIQVEEATYPTQDGGDEDEVDSGAFLQSALSKPLLSLMGSALQNVTDPKPVGTPEEPNDTQPPSSTATDPATSGQHMESQNQGGDDHQQQQQEKAQEEGSNVEVAGETGAANQSNITDQSAQGIMQQQQQQGVVAPSGGIASESGDNGSSSSSSDSSSTTSSSEDEEHEDGPVVMVKADELELTTSFIVVMPDQKHYIDMLLDEDTMHKTEEQIEASPELHKTWHLFVAQLMSDFYIPAVNASVVTNHQRGRELKAVTVEWIENSPDLFKFLITTPCPPNIMDNARRGIDIGSTPKSLVRGNPADSSSKATCYKAFGKYKVLHLYPDGNDVVDGEADSDVGQSRQEVCYDIFHMTRQALKKEKLGQDLPDDVPFLIQGGKPESCLPTGVSTVVPKPDDIETIEPTMESMDYPIHKEKSVLYELRNEDGTWNALRVMEMVAYLCTSLLMMALCITIYCFFLPKIDLESRNRVTDDWSQPGVLRPQRITVHKRGKNDTDYFPWLE